MSRRANTFIRQLGTTGTVPPVGLGYGVLYNGYAIADARNLAPLDCHIPTQAEWTTLINYLGGESVAGGKLKETGTTHWNTPNTGATNETGFTALAGGQRQGQTGGGDASINLLGLFWTSTKPFSGYTQYRLVYYNNNTCTQNAIIDDGGFSLRCICDTSATTITDLDGYKYDVVDIGTQRWLAQNLRVTKYRNGDSIPNVTDYTVWTELTSGAYAYYNNDSGNL